MDTILLIVQIVLAIFLTVIVLLQKSSSIGLGAYGGSNESIFGAKGAGGFLTKLTFIMGFLFVVNTVALTYLYNQSKEESVTDMLPVPTAPSAPITGSPMTPMAPSAPVAPSVPASDNKIELDTANQTKKD